MFQEIVNRKHDLRGRNIGEAYASAAFPPEPAAGKHRDERETLDTQRALGIPGLCLAFNSRAELLKLQHLGIRPPSCQLVEITSEAASANRQSRLPAFGMAQGSNSHVKVACWPSPGHCRSS